MKRFIRIIIYLAISAIIIGPFATSTAYASFKTYKIPTALTTETETEIPDINIELVWDYLSYSADDKINPNSLRVTVEQEELPYVYDKKDCIGSYPINNGYRCMGFTFDKMVFITYNDVHYKGFLSE